MKSSKPYYIDPNTGRRISVGSILVMNADNSFGIVRNIFLEDGVLQVLLQQPSGRYRIRSLEYDLKEKNISLMYEADEKIIKNLLKFALFADRPEYKRPN